MEARRREYLEAMGVTLWQRRSVIREPAVAVPAARSSSAATRLPADGPGASSAPDSALRARQIAGLAWDDLPAMVASCTACRLHCERTQTVFGTGSPAAEWMVVGEAPGAEEDRRGEPFVGRAGQLLNAMLKAAGFDREQVYIANILKCRPPGNRNPKAAEAESCLPFLARQIELVNPRLILAVGRVAVHHLLQTDAPLARLRGRTHYYGPDNRPVVVTYHPAYLLRSPGEKRKAWQDLQYALRLARELGA